MSNLARVAFGLLVCLVGCGGESDKDADGASGNAGRGGANASGGSGGRPGTNAGNSGVSGGLGASGSAGASNAMCGAAPCGGSVVGTWRIEQTCIEDSTTPDPNCDGGTITVSNVRETGTVTFTDASYTSSGRVAFDLTQTFPSSSLDDQGLTCQVLSQSFNVLAGGVCTAMGANCVCVGSLDEPASASGTYSVSGNNLTLVRTDAAPSTSEYCVQGTTLHMRVPAMPATMMGMPAMLAASIVLSKQ